MIILFKTSSMKKYKAIFVKTEEADISGENIYDAIKKAEKKAKKLGMKLGTVADYVKGEPLVYKPKIEMA